MRIYRQLYVGVPPIKSLNYTDTSQLKVLQWNPSNGHLNKGQLQYHLAGNFQWCKFSYELPIKIFNIRTAQHRHIEQGNFRKF